MQHPCLGAVPGIALLERGANDRNLEQSRFEENYHDKVGLDPRPRFRSLRRGGELGNRLTKITETTAGSGKQRIVGGRYSQS